MVIPGLVFVFIFLVFGQLLVVCVIHALKTFLIFIALINQVILILLLFLLILLLGGN